MQTFFRRAAAGILAVVLSMAALTASAQDRSQTWEFTAGLVWSDSLSLDGQQGTGLDIDDDLGFSFGGNYNFTNRLSAGFSFGWLSPSYEATFLPEDGPPFETIRASMDMFTIAGRGTFNFLEGPLTPYVELGFGWTAVDSNIADGPPITGCWWDPWWGYMCAPFYDTYSEDVTSWSGALGIRWDIDRTWGLKASYGILDINTSSRTEDASMDMIKVEAYWRY